MQKIIVTGNLGADAIVQNYQGNSFVAFRIAATEKFNNNGTQESRTTWYDCTWNKSDSKLLEYLKKGQKLLVIGRPSYRLYDSAVHRCKMVGISIFCETIELCGGDSQNGSNANQAQPAGEQPQQTNMPFPPENDAPTF